MLPYLVRHGSRKSSATHSYRCVQYFRVSKQWYGCQCLGFLMCAQLLMREIACNSSTDTVRDSAQQVDSGRKIPRHAGDSNQYQYCAWLFSRMLYQLSYPCPAIYIFYQLLPFVFGIHTGRNNTVNKSDSEGRHLLFFVGDLYQISSEWLDDDDCFYTALFSALEQTHCACM